MDGQSDDERALLGEALCALRRERGKVWNTPAEYARSNDVRELGKTGWSHSQWDWRRLVQSSNDKLHFLVQFTRYDAGGKPIRSYESLYILTLKDGHWGVQARSSYAGIVAKGSAF